MASGGSSIPRACRRAAMVMGVSVRASPLSVWTR
jgi:hypothetical protein